MNRSGGSTDSWATRFTVANGVKLAYFDVGSGIPLIMIHGWPIHSLGWRRLARELTPAFRVVALDLRGCGDSEITESGFDKRTLAKDVKSLAEQLGIDKFIAIGHDWGVTIAFRLALDYPDSVLGVIVSQGRLPLLPSHTTLTYSPQQVRERWYAHFNMVETLPEIVVGKAIPEYFTYLCTHFSGGKLVQSNEDMRELFRVLSRPNGLTAGFGLYRTSIGTDVADWQEHAGKRVQTPTLALWAKADPIITPEYLIGLDRHFPNLFVEMHETAGHFLPEEDPEWCAQRIRSFVKQRALI